MKTCRYTLRVLARLLDYPDAALRAHLDELRQALHDEQALDRSRLTELDALIASLARPDALEVEADYVQLFDSGRSASLQLFEHVHGDSRERGPAMIDLAQSYEKAGLYLAQGEQPDHLPVLLEYASTQPPKEARALLGETAHVLNAIFDALQRRGSRYAAALGALLELAGERAGPVRAGIGPHGRAGPTEPSLDESWAEPLAFDGCSTQGQARAGQPQPVHIVRHAVRRAAVPASTGA
jgi:nitrate reductase delta subunit